MGIKKFLPKVSVGIVTAAMVAAVAVPGVVSARNNDNSGNRNDNGNGNGQGTSQGASVKGSVSQGGYGGTNVNLDLDVHGDNNVITIVFNFLVG